MEVIINIPEDINKLCRTCFGVVLEPSEKSFQNKVVEDNEFTNIANMIASVTSLDLNVDDGLPHTICDTCLQRLTLAIEFRDLCIKTDVHIRDLLNYTDSDDLPHDEAEEIALNAPLAIKIEEFVDEERLLSCKHCTKQFKTQGGLKNHSKIHQGCDKPVVKAYDHDKINITANKEVESAFEIETCNKEYRCELCHRIFVDNLLYSMHFYKHLVNFCADNALQNVCIYCECCGEKFSDAKQLHKHVNLSHKMLQSFCDLCNVAFVDKVALFDHSVQQHYISVYHCPACLETFDSTDDLDSHAKTHPQLIIDTFNCIFCAQQFSSECSLLEHALLHMQDSFWCRMCHKHFVTKSSLDAHVHSTHGSPSCLCSTCGKLFFSNKSLKTHIISVHKKERPYVCNVCHKGFASLARLTVHKKIHSNDKEFVCTYCPYSTHKSGDLQVHLRKHTGEKPYRCKFPNCDKSFKTWSNRSEHYRRHVNEKPFECKVCGKKFTVSSTLKFHMMSHTGEKPHRCAMCGQTFRRTHHLAIHMRLHSEVFDASD